MTPRFRRLFFVFAGVVSVAPLTRADVLHLARGGHIEGVLVREDPKTITIDVGMGRVSVPRSSVIRIERKESALSEYRARLAALAPGDLAGFVDLARFASEHGMRGESTLMWARVLALDPRNVEGHLALGHVLASGTWVDEDEANRAKGLVLFEGRWMTPLEQEWLLRDRERRSVESRQIEEARRATREAEDRARRAEGEAARARADSARSSSFPVWGYGSPVLVGGPHWGGYTSGCSGLSCSTVPPIWPAPPPAPVATPLPRAAPVHPSSIR